VAFWWRAKRFEFREVQGPLSRDADIKFSKKKLLAVLHIFLYNWNGVKMIIWPSNDSSARR
jgi:hypothetical protein